jgi:hypothetical protein
MLKVFRFSENLAILFFILLRHKFLSIAYVRLVNFNAEKRKKKEQKIRKPRCFEYMLPNLLWVFVMYMTTKPGRITTQRTQSTDRTTYK